MSEKDRVCITCNGLGEIGVIGCEGLLVGCFDCDYDGKVTKDEYEKQIEYHRKLNDETI